MTESRSTQGAARGRAGAETSAAAEELRSGAREVTAAGRERARGFLDDQKQLAAQRMHGIAEALRATSRKLEEEGEPESSASFTQDAAERVDRLASALRERDVDGLLDEAEGVARRSPALFVGGAVAAGFALARFLKSSGERRMHGAHDGGPLAGTGMGGTRMTGTGMGGDPLRGTRPDGDVLTPHARPPGAAGTTPSPATTPGGTTRPGDPNRRL